jgi:hypothetical protein
MVFMGLDSNDSLLRVTIEPGGAALLVREDNTVFSRDRFFKWVEEFPYRYGIDTQSFSLFHTSTEEIGVSDLPTRAAIISSTVLQRVPPNILRIGDGSPATIAGSSPLRPWHGSRLPGRLRRETGDP